MWRLVLVFAGIVLMINGCNGLLSGQFGTQKLRKMPLSEAIEGVGDADYLELTGADLGAPAYTTPASGGAAAQVQWPLVTPEQQRLLAAGTPIQVQAVGWVETTSLPLQNSPQLMRGFVSTPRPAGDPAATWSSAGIELATPTLYLHLGEAPLAWYWQALMCVGGLLLALGTEAFRFSHRRASSAE